MGCIQSLPDHTSHVSPLGIQKFVGDPLDENNVRQQLANFTTTTPKPHGWTVYGKVVSVHDGDTFNVAIAWGSEIVIMSVRLLGCDAPELSKKEEKLPALIVKEYVKKLFEDDSFVKLETPKTKDKYGRLLAKIIRLKDNLDIAKDLVSRGYAYAYDGGKKKLFKDWWTGVNC